MQGLKEWIVSISTMVVLIAGVEMILPDNSIRKYCKFVMGLILMIVVINPMINMLNPMATIKYEMQDVRTMFEYSNRGESNRYMEATIESYTKSFKRNCERIFKERLKEKYPDKSFEIDVMVSYDEEQGLFGVDAVTVGIGDERRIRRIKPIVIGKSRQVAKIEKDERIFDEVLKEMTIYTNLEVDDIKVYSLDGE